VSTGGGRTRERTMRLADVLSPTIALARDGFPMYDDLHGHIAGQADRFLNEWPSSAAVF
jgi:gamma-glutamyltranspeptidase